MALTILMFVILIISYALMFGLVKFTHNVIAVPDSPGDGDLAVVADKEQTP
jgi:hypothetical protein